MPQEVIVCLPDISEQVSDDGKITIDFLLPNGMFVPKTVDFEMPLDMLKQVVWNDARKLPLFDKLRGHDSYYFEYLNRNGEREEVCDESLRLSEIRPIGKFLRVHERKTEEKYKTVDRQITTLLGSRSLLEINSTPRAEVDDFRKKMHHFTQLKCPDTHDFMTMFRNKYPLQLRSSTQLPYLLEKRLKDGYLILSVAIKETETKFFLQSHALDSPEDVVDHALRKWHNHSVRNNYDYILKVVGQDHYLYDKAPLHQFKYVYSCLQRNVAPEFWLVKKTSVLTIDNLRPTPRPRPRPATTRVPKKHRDVLVWEIEDNFEMNVTAIHNIEITSEQVKDNIDKVKLFIGLYHGSEVLGDVKTTNELPVSGGNCDVNVKLTFDLPVMDVQLASRLCFTLHGRMKGSKSLNPIAWVNIPVFDFRSRLLMGEHKLPMWPVTAELQLWETGCYPLGSVSLNPHNTITLTVYFSDYNRAPPLIYPPDDEITNQAADYIGEEPPGAAGSPDWHAPKQQLEELKVIINSQAVSDCLHENDKELVWMMRYECRDKYPHALPLVLKSVKWNYHQDVAKMQVLLATWKEKIPVDQALELLDFNFPDKNVRKYGVDCLQELSDDELSLYLLQLVQALKYETYLYCPLAEYLMERALRNEHIGHQLFWLLKSELHNPTVTVRYGLILESYLKANPEHMHVLYKQFEGLNKLNGLSQLLKAEKIIDKKTKDKAKEHMHTVLKQRAYQEKLAYLYSPLSPLFKLGELNISLCRFMDSKKRPLYLVWDNVDKDGPEIHIIYKNGDDLRQDMLTLQLLQVMDSIWQAEGLDLRLNAYGCVASGFEQGMIEVVRHASTIANIQQAANSSLDKKTLFDWLKDKNKTEKELDQAVEEFTMSCAGYAVATYILGIGDRHNDNIMLKETGQLFHIDFGHFLGNFKSKFGLKRERAPFVLTSHFVYIITKGGKDTENYKRFEEYCLSAYLALRKRGTLLIRLFMMMLTSGIPQLTTVSDLDYLKYTLALEMSEEDAKKSFRNKMIEALNSMSVKINWWFHNVVHGN